jgi:hypothetical protein
MSRGGIDDVDESISAVGVATPARAMEFHNAFT